MRDGARTLLSLVLSFVVITILLYVIERFGMPRWLLNMLIGASVFVAIDGAMRVLFPRRHAVTMNVATSDADSFKRKGQDQMAKELHECASRTLRRNRVCEYTYRLLQDPPCLERYVFIPSGRFASAITVPQPAGSVRSGSRQASSLGQQARGQKK